jgi:transposase
MMDATARLHFCAVAVIVTVALKYACPPLAESGGAGVVQAGAPAQLPEGCAAIRHWFGDARARPDLALLAQIAVSGHSGHLPLNRQAVIMARHRVAIGRSTLADWMGRTGWAGPDVAIGRADSPGGRSDGGAAEDRQFAPACGRDHRRRA